MDYILIIIGLLFIFIGILGSFLPVLPGPPLSWLGILLLYCTQAVPWNWTMLIVTFIIAVVTVLLDYIIPAQGTKRFGGSKYGIWGTNIGLVIGIFAPIPFGFIIGPFLGAFIGELLYDSKDKNKAFRSAVGSFIGFLASTFMKFVVCMIYAGIFFWVLIQNWDQF